MNKTLALLAHVDAGKTTLTEALLFHTGVLRTRGRVDDGTAATDTLPVEKERGISVRAADCAFSYRGQEITLIDTPGHMDFSGEVERSIAAVDGAVLMVTAVEGVQAHTETIWQSLRDLNIPTILFVNKIDRAGARPEEVRMETERLLKIPTVPLNRVAGAGSREAKVEKAENPEKILTEACCDFSEEAAEAYLAEEKTDLGHAMCWLSEGVRKGKILPVIYGTALFDRGVEDLLNAVCDLLPAAAEGDEELSALVYRVEHDKTMGRLAHVRLFSGSFQSRMQVDYPGEERQPAKIAQIRQRVGTRWEDTGRVSGAQTALLCGLSEVRVFDWFGKKPAGKLPNLANPYLQVKVTPKEAGQLTRLVQALHELEAEDPHLAVRWEKTEREVVISITGSIEKEVLADLLKERYGLEALFSAPSVIYKETPKKAGRAYADYLMPKPCWAIVELMLEPLPTGSGVVYDGGHIPHDQLNMKYQEHIRRSFYQTLKQGIHGWEVTDLKATLIGGGHHLIHTHPLDFFVATPMALLNGLRDTGSDYLEPILKCRIQAGEEYMGKILSDITLMRGSFESPVVISGEMTVECLLPVQTSMDYSLKLASLTGGRGRIRAVLDSWQPCPDEFAQPTPYRGVCPLDRSKWILYKRGAYTQNT